MDSDAAKCAFEHAPGMGMALYLGHAAECISNAYLAGGGDAAAVKRD